MKTLLLISTILTLCGSAPIFTTFEKIPENRHGKIYVTVDYGICLDKSGNGKLYGYGSGNNYISYKGVGVAKPGDKIHTYCVINPKNNKIDDVICRIDIVEGHKEIFIIWDND